VQYLLLLKSSMNQKKIESSETFPDDRLKDVQKGETDEEAERSADGSHDGRKVEQEHLLDHGQVRRRIGQPQHRPLPADLGVVSYLK